VCRTQIHVNARTTALRPDAAGTETVHAGFAHVVLAMQVNHAALLVDAYARALGAARAGAGVRKPPQQRPFQERAHSANLETASRSLTIHQCSVVSFVRSDCASTIRKDQAFLGKICLPPDVTHPAREKIPSRPGLASSGSS